MTGKKRLRSREWFDNPHDPGMTALYLERYLNYGLTLGELRGDKPIIGIAQSGSALSPYNRHHLELAKRVRGGIIAAGRLPIGFPPYPLPDIVRRPPAPIDRHLTIGRR